MDNGKQIDAHTRATTDRETIRQWVSERGGMPSMLRRTNHAAEDTLLINFPNDGSDEPAIDISWADFFRHFDDRNLAFIYQESLPDAEDAQVYQLVDRYTLR
jgi:hypothetical protein